MKSLTPAETRDLAAQIKAIADPARLQLLALIAHTPDTITADLVEDLGYLSHATVVHHLKTLRTAGLITAEPYGRFVHFRVAGWQMSELAAAVRRYAP